MARIGDTHAPLLERIIRRTWRWRGVKRCRVCYNARMRAYRAKKQG